MPNEYNFIFASPGTQIFYGQDGGCRMKEIVFIDFYELIILSSK